jgi:hypothetical protein
VSHGRQWQNVTYRKIGRYLSTALAHRSSACCFWIMGK